ncbi:MAG: Flagellar motor switch protein FliM [Firmicutes bacterium ADurb.Bin356]|nr:MAG: Flagellar motor switch protein FliM [Firmicutes bacterium ADurb.Bin356]
MADILSQSEIDELLLALASGQDLPAEPEAEEVSGQVRKYDFRTANKFSKEQIRMLHFIYENYAGRLSTFLSGALRAMCEVKVVSIEEQTFSEFSNSLPSPTFLAIANMPPLAGTVLFEISAQVAYEIVSCLLGGAGGLVEQAGKPFTEIEISILTRVSTQMLLYMKESWERITKISPTIDRVETSPQFAQIVAGSEPISIITMSVTIGEVSDIINLCIPHLAIQPIAKKLDTKLWYNERSSYTANEGMTFDTQLSPRISTTELALRALFNTTRATVGDILNLQVGDVIRVDHPLSANINVLVEHIPKFKGSIGQKGKQLSVKVSEIIREVAADD